MGRIVSAAMISAQVSEQMCKSPSRCIVRAAPQIGYPVGLSYGSVVRFRCPHRVVRIGENEPRDAGREFRLIRQGTQMGISFCPSHMGFSSASRKFKFRLRRGRLNYPDELGGNW